ncbi:MAG: ATP-binding protein, partial [Candidatus Methylomirabilales bacterium]
WGTVRVGISLERMEAEIAQTQTQIILFGIAAVILGSLGSVIVARRITGPIRKLVNGAEAVGRGDLSQQITVRSGDEIGELASAFNKMTHQLSQMRELEERLRRSERLAALGTMAAGIAHDIRNPLTSISIFAQLITTHHADPDVRAKFERVVPRELERVQRTLEDMLELARPSSLSFEPTDINEMLLQVFEVFEQTLTDRKVVVTPRLAHPLPRVQADRKKLYRCLSNLMENAIQSMPQGGEVTIRSALVYQSAPATGPPPADPTAMQETLPYVKVSIRDTGHGIPREVLARIFDPFFTTKERGVGLGMAIAHRVVEDHHGTIDVSSLVGQGTTVTISLPVPSSAAHSLSEG